MVETVFGIYPHDSVHAPFVLRRMKAEKLSVRDEYEDLICKKCRKVDERAAFARGIQRVPVRSKLPFLGSLDNYYLLDNRAKQVFAELFPDEIDYFPIPSTGFCVASAKVWLQPEERNPGLRFARPRCRECDRAGEVIWGKEPLVVTMRKRFFAVNLESVMGARETWIVSAEMAARLRDLSPPLTGMSLSPIQLTIGDSA